MNPWKRRVAAAWCAVAVLTLVGAVAAEAGAQAPAVDPAAVEILKRMTEFLAGAQQFSVSTHSIIEEMHVSGHRVDYDLSARVTVKRPNKLRAVRTGEMTDERLFYDGTTLTAYRPAAKVYATEKGLDTIEAMITFARETVGVLLPSADLLYRNAFPLLMQDVTLAVVVGKPVIRGVRYDHLLFSRPGVDFQLWITQGKQPWPARYTVTETGTPALLSISTVLRDWNPAPAGDDAQFTFVPPKGAKAIAFTQFEKAGGATR
jgi:hypothetical protein